jgi:predicted outer membrane repeat protein
MNIRLIGWLMVDSSELKVTDCSIEAPPSPTIRSRALSVLDGATVELLRVVLRGHSAGAISVEATHLGLSECTLRDNAAQPSGGALVVRPNSVVEIRRCTFSNNSATVSGGALQVSTSTNRAPTDICTPTDTT